MYIPKPLFKEKAIQELKELWETTIIDLLEKNKIPFGA